MALLVGSFQSLLDKEVQIDHSVGNWSFCLCTSMLRNAWISVTLSLSKLGTLVSFFFFSTVLPGNKQSESPWIIFMWLPIQLSFILKCHHLAGCVIITNYKSNSDHGQYLPSVCLVLHRTSFNLLWCQLRVCHFPPLCLFIAMINCACVWPETEVAHGFWRDTPARQSLIPLC